MDLLSRPRALRALVAIVQNEPMPMLAFMDATGYVSEPAQRLRDELVNAGLVVMKRRLMEPRGMVKELYATPYARRIVEHALEIERIASDAQRAHDKKQDKASGAADADDKDGDGASSGRGKR